jgi:hypothetical protein
MLRWTNLTAFSQSRRGSHCDGRCQHRSTADQPSMRHFDSFPNVVTMLLTASLAPMGDTAFQHL